VILDVSKKASSQLINSAQSSRGKVLAQVGVALVLVLLIGAIGVSIAIKKEDKDKKEAARVASAQGPTAISQNGLRFGKADSKVVVTLVEDLQCPSCKLFESQAAETIDGLIKSGKVAVEYRTISFLDQMSTTNYSSRAANASACVAESDKNKWFDWHEAMFRDQPAEQSAGLTDDRLVAIAREQGLTSQQTADCINSQKYADYVKK